MYSPYSFNYNITSIVYYRHIDNSLYQKEWDVNVPLLGFTVRKRNDIFVKIANNSFFKRIAKNP